MARVTRLARHVGALAALYGCGCLLGLGLLVAAFQFGLLSGFDILFYRGLVVIALAAVATFAILAVALCRAASLGARDAFAAAVLSLSLNLSFLVVVPVTVDRSISIFLLGEMAAQQDSITPDSASRLFKSVYVDEYRQIDRRLHEQAVSGNVVADGGGYKITPRGRLVVEVAKTVAWLFDSRAGLTAPHAPAPYSAVAARR